MLQTALNSGELLDISHFDKAEILAACEKIKLKMKPLSRKYAAEVEALFRDALVDQKCTDKKIMTLLESLDPGPVKARVEHNSVEEEFR